MLISLCIRCNYDPDDEYYKDIDPTLPVAQITLNNSESLISIWKTTNFSYALSSSKNLNIIETKVYIDNALIVSSSTSPVNFLVDPAQYSAGNHVIRITTVTNSGTGSLADKIGAEGVLFEKEWVLVIEHFVPGNRLLHIKDMSIEKGFLKITWEKYDDRDFQSYTLYSTCTFAKPDYWGYDLVTTIYNSTLNYFYDPTYVGGLRAYHVYLQASDLNFGGYVEMIDTADYPFPELLKIQPEGYGLHVSYSKCLFPAAFKEYRISIIPDSYHDIVEKAVIQNIADTAIFFPDLPFGSEFTFVLTTYPVGVDHQAGTPYEPTSKFISHIGSTSFEYASGMAFTAGSFIYFSKDFDGNIYRYSATDHSVSKIYENTWNFYYPDIFQLSYDGLYLFKGEYSADASKLFSLPDMTENSSHEFVNCRSSKMSNNGLIPVITEHEFMVYDCLHKTYIDTLYTNFTGYYPGGTYYGSESCISPDGDFLYARSVNADTLYHRTAGNNYLPVFSPPIGVTFLEFNPLNDDELIYYNPNALIVFNYRTLSVSRTYSHIKASVSHIDPVTGHFLALENTPERRFGIYNIADGSKIGSILMSNNVSAYDLLLYNDVIYSRYGYKMEIAK